MSCNDPIVGVVPTVPDSCGGSVPPAVEVETSGFEACYFDGTNDIPCFVKIVDNEDGTLKEYIISYLDGSGATVVQADLVNVKTCVEDSADIVECEFTNTLNLVGEASDANIEAAAAITGASSVTTFHPALDTTVNLIGNIDFGVMGAGINVNIGTAVTGAVFTYNLDFISDTDPGPGDPGDFGIVVWDNNANTSVAATSIVTSLVSSFDAQGVGLNYPIYAIPNPIVNPYTIVWTGDLPVGDYSVLFVSQNHGVTDQINLLIDYVVPAGVAGTSRALLTALDQCTIDALTPDPVTVIEVPNGAIIVNAASMSVLVGTNLVRSFSVKGLGNKTYDISFDGGATFLDMIDGGDSWGEGNSDMLDISSVVIRPTNSGDNVFIHWESI